MTEAFSGPKILIKDTSSKEPTYSETVAPVRTSLDIEQISGGQAFNAPSFCAQHCSVLIEPRRVSFDVKSAGDVDFA